MAEGGREKEVIVVRDIAQNTPEWLALRVGVLTASNFHKVTMKGRGGKDSVTRAALIDQLATERITGRSAEEGYSNYWMDRGKEREDLARSIYEFQTGHEVEQVGFIYMDDSKLIGCSPDGLVGEPGMVEIKCPKLSTHLGYIRHGIDAHMPQIQGQMMVADRQWSDFVSYCPESHIELWTVRVERDDEYIEQLLIACRLLLAEVDHVEKELRGYE